ncbi:maleylacetoacetate isomerase [Myxococcota bacterium]|nr:maleylacetoacetate isomerase [Myxococcota bacterium]MBU1899289.1 maleylacetoacetate isomerase [Myxococcota bacterium]
MSERALYGYFRSSAAFRVRIALALKGLDYESISVHLVRVGGEHRQPTYLAKNPQGRVPTYEEGAWRLSQSPAILEYLEEAYPEPALLPADLKHRARARQIAALVGCDIHPLNNLSVLQYLKAELSIEQAALDRWYHHWINEGFSALEKLLQEDTIKGQFCCGNLPTLADIYLIPQIWNARRFNMDMSVYPTLCQIEASCYQLDAFTQSRPENQPEP